MTPGSTNVKPVYPALDMPTDWQHQWLTEHHLWEFRFVYEEDFTFSLSRRCKNTVDYCVGEAYSLSCLLRIGQPFCQWMQCNKANDTVRRLFVECFEWLSHACCLIGSFFEHDFSWNASNQHGGNWSVYYTISGILNDDLLTCRPTLLLTTVVKVFNSVHVSCMLHCCAAVPSACAIFRSGTDLISLLILFFFLLFWLERPLQKSLRLRRFKSGEDDTLQDCSLSK